MSSTEINQRAGANHRKAVFPVWIKGTDSRSKAFEESRLRVCGWVDTAPVAREGSEFQVALQALTQEEELGV